MSRLRQLNRSIFDFPPARFIGRRIYAAKRARQVPTQSTTTKFFRHLNQLRAFEGPLNAFTTQRKLRVLVVGCSMGCEAYTFGAYIAEFFPDLDWSIDAIDISHEALNIAQRGRFAPKYGLGISTDPAVIALERRLFDGSTGKWQVRDDVRARISFAYGDVLSPDFQPRGGYDVVVGQNFMIHMPDTDEALAFGNLVAAVRDGGALFVAGMNLDRRAKLVVTHGLLPVEWNLAAIHDADEIRRSAWPWKYWSLEPMNHRARPFLERYATLFLKPCSLAVVEPARALPGN